MRDEARPVRPPFDIRITRNEVVARRRLIADARIRAEQIAIVETRKQAVAAQVRHAVVVVAAIDAQRQPVLGLQDDIGGIRGGARRIDHVDTAIRVRIQEREARGDIGFADRLAGGQRHLAGEECIGEIAIALREHAPRAKLGNRNAHHAVAHVLLGHVDIDERQARLAITLHDGAANFGQTREGERMGEIGREGIEEVGIEQRRATGRDRSALRALRAGGTGRAVRAHESDAA